MSLKNENSVCASAPSNPVPRRGVRHAVDPVSRLPAAIRGWARRVASCRLPALVLGETGAGKERVARALHLAGPRRASPFVAVNVAALPETLLEAELFGAVRGAYTGAERDRKGVFRRAAGGTLFLDEVGDMPPALQAKMLRVLQEGRMLPLGSDEEIAVDARIVAATHRDLAEECAAGRFRLDLYYRLAVLEIRLPPLRQRLGELGLLVTELSPALCRDTGCPAPRLTDEAWSALRGHSWPGNVRELQAVLARAMLKADGRRIVGEDLEFPALDIPRARNDGEPLERTMIRRALAASGGRFSEAARRIGWSRQKLYRRVRALALALPSAEDEPSTSSESSTFQ